MGLRLPILDDCCCGCTLRQGCLILGWLKVIVIFISLVGCIIGLLSSSGDKEYVYDKQDLPLYTVAGFIAFLVESVFLYGTCTENVKILHVAVIVQLIVLIFYSIVNIIGVLYIAHVDIQIAGLVGLILMFSLLAYFWLVLRSYWLVVKEKQIIRADVEVELGAAGV